MSTLARWCFRHRYAAIGLWLVLLVGLGVLSQAAGTTYKSSSALPGTGSSKAQQLLAQAVPEQAGDADTVVWRVENGSVRDQQVAARMSSVLKQIATMPDVAGVISPYATDGAGQISADGRTAYAAVNFTKEKDDLAKPDIQRVVDAARAARGPGLDVQLGGQAIALTDETPLSVTAAVGLVAAAVVLFIAFGSLLGMLLPIITAIAGVAGGMLAIAPLTHAMDVTSYAPFMGALIGLGVGTDYALFIVTRHRSGLLKGRTPEESAVTALDTSGRAVLFAGGTVAIALLGILILGVNFLNGLAAAMVLTVAFTVLAAVTLLPALLGIFGMRVLSRRQRRALGKQDVNGTPAKAGPWARWTVTVQRRPRAMAAVATAVIVLLSMPLLSLRLGTSDQGNDPQSSTTRQAYDMLAEGFGPGFNGPLLVVAQTGSDADEAALKALETRLPHVANVAAVTSVATAHDVHVIKVTPGTSPQAQRTVDLIDTLRKKVVPAAEQGTTLHVYVGGATATSADFASVVGSKLPWFLLAIVGLSFLLLVVAFRSLLIPATAAVMNLLGAAASFGVLTAFFQFGWGTEAFGMGKAGPVEAFLPPLQLALLFGLSMDYQVFLVSRMHEEWVHNRRNADAVRIGQVETGRVITAAAMIMLCVFLTFSFLGTRAVAEPGIGLTVAVALDAFILRTVLVPAVMYLFGNANWWLPRWLDRRLPHLAIDPPESADGTADPVMPAAV
ncbi:MMPL family transporter [Streptomyces sp. GbtcB6]|uniref:MMPL family transporter n=1 Tax=Streptomyces sp. GbtcB6 TaxID=2824751 RepID=UPI001C300A50|nr:MMPL family transporter [Streptomyces sp. GbtcB6]